MLIYKFIYIPIFLYNIFKDIFKINIKFYDFNKNIGPENLNIEYKQFTFINNIPLDLEEAKYYCYTNKILPNLNLRSL